jgi:hypothetical protein
MAIIPGKFCEGRCAEHEAEPVPAEYEWLGGYLCDGCMTNEAEAAHERMLEDYYGASSPQTLSEQYQQDTREKKRDR